MKYRRDDDRPGYGDGSDNYQNDDWSQGDGLGSQNGYHCGDGYGDSDFGESNGGGGSKTIQNGYS